ncbi:hypothetical protein PCE1_000933 [Barthelona sp. PCE]
MEDTEEQGNKILLDYLDKLAYPKISVLIRKFELNSELIAYLTECLRIGVRHFVISSVKNNILDIDEVFAGVIAVFEQENMVTLDRKDLKFTYLFWNTEWSTITERLDNILQRVQFLEGYFDIVAFHSPIPFDQDEDINFSETKVFYPWDDEGIAKPTKEVGKQLLVETHAKLMAYRNMKQRNQTDNSGFIHLGCCFFEIEDFELIENRIDVAFIECNVEHYDKDLLQHLREEKIPRSSLLPFGMTGKISITKSNDKSRYLALNWLVEKKKCGAVISMSMGDFVTFSPYLFEEIHISEAVHRSLRRAEGREVKESELKSYDPVKQYSY